MNQTVTTVTPGPNERVHFLLELPGRVARMTDEDLVARLAELEPLTADAELASGRSMTEAYRAGERAQASGAAVDAAIAEAAQLQDDNRYLTLQILLQEEDVIWAEQERRRQVRVTKPNRRRRVARFVWDLFTVVMPWLALFVVAGVVYVKAATPVVTEQEIRDTVRVLLGVTLLGCVAELRGWLPVVFRFQARQR